MLQTDGRISTLLYCSCEKCAVRICGHEYRHCPRYDNSHRCDAAARPPSIVRRHRSFGVRTLIQKIHCPQSNSHTCLHCALMAKNLSELNRRSLVFFSQLAQYRNLLATRRTVSANDRCEITQCRSRRSLEKCVKFGLKRSPESTSRRSGRRIRGSLYDRENKKDEHESSYGLASQSYHCASSWLLKRCPVQHRMKTKVKTCSPCVDCMALTAMRPRCHDDATSGPG